MPYITASRGHRFYQLSFNDILNGVDPKNLEVTKDTHDTTTWYSRCVSYKTLSRISFQEMFDAIRAFNEKYKDLIDTEDKAALYYSFKIP
ncbi:MAG: hypothetical protein IKP74_04895, partial [Clostridia bacterium]|nr:hypothetical protein [Clostridia bacterium]